MNNWFDHILYNTRTIADQPAIVMEDRAVTYGMLGAGIERCARRIAGLSIAPGTPVAILVRNPLRHLILSFALFRLGLPSISLEQSQSGVARLDLPIVLGDADARTALGFGRPVVDVTDEWFAADIPAPHDMPAGFSDHAQVCHISLTSGSTGEARRVSHSVTGIGRRVFEKYLGAIDSCRRSVLCMMGLSSNYGFTTACATLVAGKTLCFADQPYQAVRMIELYAIDFAMMSTEQLLSVTRVAKKSAAQLRSLETVWFGGSAPTRVLLEAAAIHLCRNINCRYGASEAGLIARATAREMLALPGFVGHIVPGIEVGVFDDAGHRRAAGDVGHIRVRHDRPDDGSPGAAPSPASWVDLGDRGWTDPDGRIFLVDRAADIDAAGAGSGTRRLSPVHEIEHLLRLEWDMADAAAVAGPPGQPGTPQQIWVGIVGNEGASADALEAQLRARGLDCAIRLVDLKAIPRGLNGKVNRAQLKAAILAAMPAAGRS
jgi:acyl-coenzyme A synthetase/AMP-(fatty) acid ligase